MGEGNVVELEEGERATFPLTSINSAELESNNNDLVQPNKTFVGNVGTLDIWHSGNEIYYDIDMSIPATGFLGNLRITNNTSGFSSGLTPVTGFSGSARYNALDGHSYSASLTGTAYFLGLEVAKTTWNRYNWIN